MFDTRYCLVLPMALLFLAHGLTACTASMVAFSPTYKDPSVLRPGTPRAVVIEEYGEPERTRISDWNLVDTFRYRQALTMHGQRLRWWDKAILVPVLFVYTVGSLGITELVGTPATILAWPDVWVLEVTYDEWDRVFSSQGAKPPPAEESHREEPKAAAVPLYQSEQPLKRYEGSP